MSHFAVTKTTPTVAIVSCAVTATMTLMMAPSPHRPSSSFRSWYGYATTIESKGHNEGFCWPLCSNSNLSLTCFLRLMPVVAWVLLRWFSFWELSFPLISSCCMLLSVMVFVFMLSCSHVAVVFTSGGLTSGVCTPQPFRVYLWQAYVPPGDGLWSLPGVHWVTDFPLLWVGGSLCYSLSCPPAIPLIW